MREPQFTDEDINQDELLGGAIDLVEHTRDNIVQLIQYIPELLHLCERIISVNLLLVNYWKIIFVHL